MLANGQVQTISGTGEAGIVSVRLLDAQGRSLEVAEVGQPVVLEVQAEVREDIERLVLGFLIRIASARRSTGSIPIVRIRQSTT